MIENNKNGQPNREAVKQARRDMGDYHFKSDYLIRQFLRYADRGRNKATMHLTIGGTKLQ